MNKTNSTGAGVRSGAPPYSGTIFTSLSGATRRIKEGISLWSKKNSSLWPLLLDISCCSVEVADLAHDSEGRRGGFSFTGTPERSDVMIVSGWITKAMAMELKKLHSQMLRPRYVIAYGSCATCGGPWWESYNVVCGVDRVLPVDVYVAGCPPRPEDLLAALQKLQKKVGGAIED